MNKTYPAKFSRGLLALVFILFYGPLLPELYFHGFSTRIIGVLVLLSLVYAWILHLFLNTTYTIENDLLRVRCGWFTYKPVPIREIYKIEKTRSIISAPAPSFDRLAIRYGKYNEIILSPLDKEGFVQLLARINPGIDIRLSGTPNHQPAND